MSTAYHPIGGKGASAPPAQSTSSSVQSPYPSLVPAGGGSDVAPPPAGYGSNVYAVEGGGYAPAPAPGPHAGFAGPGQRPMVEPSRVSGGFKALMVGVLLVLVVEAVVFFVLGYTDSEHYDDDDDGSTDDSTGLYFAGVWVLIMSVVVAVIVYAKLPLAMELHAHCAVLRSRCRSYSLAYERVSAVEVWASTCCTARKRCSLPRGAATAFDNAVMIRSPDCAASLDFTPADLQRFLAMVRRTPLANRIVVMN